MSDQRELILNQLATVCGSIPGIVTAARNKMQVSDLARPALIVLDGFEEVEQGYGRGKPSVAPLLVNMRPEVWVFLGGKPDDVGPSVSGFRALIIQTVLEDPTLQTLTHNGDVRYAACRTNLTLGQTIEADLGLEFEFRYVLRPSELNA